MTLLGNFMDLSIYKFKKREWKENAFNIPINLFDLNEDGAHEFNQILNYLYSLNLPRIIRTPSGGISNTGINNKYDCFDYRFSNICAEITYLSNYGSFRFQCRTQVPLLNEKQKPIYGSKALSIFKDICLKFNINIEDYAVENGLVIKNEWKAKESKIYKKYIHPSSFNLVDTTLTNVNHIDLCSGFQSGLVRAFPEFYKPCKYLYDLRKSDESLKLVQVESIGAMWSNQRNAKYIRLAKGAIEENNRLLKELELKLFLNGRKVLMLNTDGIWYQGEPYHDSTEFADLGGWKNDHLNCKFRMKNNVTYEFIENGVYSAVMSGSTLLDRVKPRELWEWGDIYRTEPIKHLIDSEGIKNNEGVLY